MDVDIQGAEAVAKTFEPGAAAMQARRPGRRVTHQTELHNLSQQGVGQPGDLQPGAGLEAQGVGAVALSEQIQVRYIDIGHQPRAQPGQPAQGQALPADHRLWPAILELQDRPAGIGQHALNGGQAGHLRRGGNTVLDALDAGKMPTLLIDDRRRQSRHRAATAEHRHPGGRRLIQRANAAHEVAAVGQVAVVDPGLDAALGHRVGLALERPSGVDHPMHVQGLERRRPLRAHGIAAPTFTGLPTLGLQRLNLGRELAWVAPGNQQMHPGRTDQIAADDAAEIAITTDHQHPERH